MAIFEIEFFMPEAMQLALNLGLARRFVLETPLMWRDKAATWAAFFMSTRPLGSALVVAMRPACAAWAKTSRLLGNRRGHGRAA